MHKPTHMFIGFQEVSRKENQGKTNMVFINNGVKKIPTNLDWSKVYAALLSAGYKNIDVDTGTVISYSDFAKLYPIFPFDFTAQDPSIF